MVDPLLDELQLHHRSGESHAVVLTSRGVSVDSRTFERWAHAVSCFFFLPRFRLLCCRLSQSPPAAVRDEPMTGEASKHHFMIVPP
jgi:hypothetical protein